ncbi:MAG: fatty acid desaturase [Pseudomonadota bacterium]|nr:fatty acid desaturase [Pseudomonadota bacterium]
MAIEVGEAAAGPSLEEDGGRFSIAGSRKIVADLFQRNPRIYWGDFLLTLAVAYGTAWLYLSGAEPVTRGIAFAISGLAIFRAGTFMHEIVHMGPGVMPGFRFFWNLLLGVPLFMPSPFYRNHVDHHSKALFGTPDDGEYLPLALGPKSELLRYLAQAPLLPLLVVARFAITPFTYVTARARAWSIERLSAFVSNPYYRQRLRGGVDLRGIRWAEWACFAWFCLLAALAVTGRIPLHYFLLIYCLMTYTLTLNWVRNLAAHRYDNAGDAMSLEAQVAESINITGQTWLTALLFPVGLRYHATHHMFPGLPYHALGEAHRRLQTQLPAGSPYHGTGRTTFWSAARELWRRASSGDPAGPVALERWRSA